MEVEMIPSSLLVECDRERRSMWKSYSAAVAENEKAFALVRFGREVDKVNPSLGLFSTKDCDWP